MWRFGSSCRCLQECRLLDKSVLFLEFDEDGDSKFISIASTSQCHFWSLILIMSCLYQLSIKGSKYSNL